MPIRIPNPSRSRALFIIDIQPGFVLNHSHLIPNVVSLIKEGSYDRFVLAEFHADPGSLWDKESQWTFEGSPTPKEIVSLLDPSRTIRVAKTAKSVFVERPELADELKSFGIEEIHCVGYDINDCVMATANDGFDLGLFSYVIEEAAESSESAELKKDALAILRENEMTNHSELITEFKPI